MSSIYKPFCFQNGVFKKITKDKEIENDKERILKKFNFFSKTTTKKKNTTTSRTTITNPKHTLNSRNNSNNSFKKHLTTKTSPSSSPILFFNKANRSFNLASPSQDSLNRTYSKIKQITPIITHSPSSNHNIPRNKLSTTSNPIKTNSPINYHKMKITKSELIMKHKNIMPIKVNYNSRSKSNSINNKNRKLIYNFKKPNSKHIPPLKQRANSNNSKLNNQHKSINISTLNNNTNNSNNNNNCGVNNNEIKVSSNETERESESHMVLVSNTLISNEIKLSHYNNNTRSSHDTYIKKNSNFKEQTLKATNSLSRQIFGNNTNFFSNSLSSNEEPNSSKKLNLISKQDSNTNDEQKNFLIESYETNNMNNTSLNQNINTPIPQYEKILITNKKIQQLFTGNAKYDIPSKLDEHNNYNQISPNTEYKFINKIRENNINLKRFNTKSFLRLSDYSTFYLLSFVYETYDILINNCHSLISSKIHLCLKNVFSDVISSFIKKYESVLKLDSYSFIHKCTFHHKKAYSILDLIIKATIITDNINKCYEIGYIYSSQKRNLENIWRFDIIKKNNITLWCSSECEKFNDNSRRFCYYQPILAFAKGDTIELNVNVFSKKSSVNPFSIKWKDLIIKEAPGGFYQKTMLKSPFAYSSLRACEVENMIHFWKGDDEFIKDNELISEFKRIFSRHFTIENVVYDISKIYLYKITMIAKSIGKIIKNKFANFDFEIVSYVKAITNEIQNLFILNASIQKKQIQIRQGTVVYFYLTDY